MKGGFLALLLACGLYAIEAMPKGLTSQSQNAQEIQKPQIPSSYRYKSITAKELNALLNSQKSLILLDVSKKGNFLIAHLPHAKHFTMDIDSLSNDGKLQWSKKNGTQDEFKEKLGGDLLAPIVIYDEGNTPPSQISMADIACMWAEKLGYQNLYRLSGGMKIWKENHFMLTHEAPHCCH